ncbi:hypothetical protein DFH06DRAFT_1362497 [Mycena polygramma]|nr:hypothetical protein DFH06DRAFT_1362497 [Mycena polygramma]
MSIPLPARAGCLLCPCRSTSWCQRMKVAVSPANIKGPNRAQQCGWFIPPRLPIQPTMPCKGCNIPWYHHDDVDMPAMPSTSGPIFKRKLPRGVQLVTEYWAAINTEDCPNWPANTANGNYAFRACYDFLKATNPSRFREIGSLAGFLLAANFSYAGVVQPPTATEVGEIIRGINKGGVRGLELLRLVGERLHGNGRAFKMGNANEIRAAFCRLHGFLDNKLSAAQKAHMVFDAIMTENSLCKLTRVAGTRTMSSSCRRLHQVALISIKASGEIGCIPKECIGFHSVLMHLGHW